MYGNIEVILVDLGNTRVKSAEVVDGALINFKSWDSFNDLTNEYPDDLPKMICNTSQETIQGINVTALTHETHLPINLDYQTPQTLGADRIAAAVGAYDLFPNQNSLIIDMGTCITMDAISKDGIFRGGIISPGLTMRMRAMSHYTANLPDISHEWQNLNNKLLGTSTKECLLAGAYGGVLHEIKGFLDEIREDFTTINVILCGGDAHHFESRLKAHIFAGSKIVLMGLYRIWIEQKKEE